MSKYFYDCEFLEGTQKKKFWWGNTVPTIDLISIGIVSEDSREYYAISKDFNLKEAWNRYDVKTEQVSGDMRNVFPEGKKTKVYWIRENVLKPIFNEWIQEYNGNIVRLGLPIALESNEFTYKNFKKWLKLKGKSNKQIAKEIIDFVNPDLGWHVTAYNNSDLKKGGALHDHFEFHNVNSDGEVYYAQPEFYGYYSAYDHVALCWLFGKMIDLPTGFPMYTIDLKQELDNKERALMNKNGKVEFVSKPFVAIFNSIKEFPNYPKQINNHNSLSDAKWNLELYKFLNEQ